MKLLMTADAVGGVWQYATDLAGALGARGVEVVIAVLGPTPPLPVREGSEVGTGAPAPGSAAGVTADLGASSPEVRYPPLTPPLQGGEQVQVISTALPLDWLCTSPKPVRAAADAIASLAREVGADLVHLNAPALAAARFDRPVVAVEHGTVATWWQAAEAGPLPADLAWHAGLTREGLLAADAVVAPTRAHAEAVRRRYALPTVPLAVHNGRAALPPASPAPPTGHAFTAGRLWDRAKRTALLDQVAALTPIRAAGPATAPHGETVACEHLELLGSLDADALGRELAGRPVFVSAAVFEPFGLAVLEAAQAGCPLVLSDIATFRELWDGAALFVAGDAPADWADAIARAKSDRDALGAAARARAARYTPDATAAAMLGIYARLLAAKGERSVPLPFVSSVVETLPNAPGQGVSTSLDTNGVGTSGMSAAA